MSKTLTQKQLKTLVHYDPLTGNFKYLHRTNYLKKEFAGGNMSNGYIYLSLSYKKYLAHRLAFLYMTGSMPEYVDHIDQKKDNNIFTNLRAVTHQENHRNTKLSKNNTSGFNGVWFETRSQKYVAEIVINNKKKRLGTFADKEYAIEARKAANIKYGFHKNHGKIGE